MINLEETQEWYAKERDITVEEFDDYDIHVCRVANAYINNNIFIEKINKFAKHQWERGRLKLDRVLFKNWIN